MSVAAYQPSGVEPTPLPPPSSPLERLFERISEVSSLPEVAMRIMRLADDPTTGADELLEAVRSDPALVMRVMRTVNSSYHGLPNQVADLKQAITLLGFDEIRNLALTAFVARSFQSGDGHASYSRRELWNHMVATSLIARTIARQCGHPAPQEAYLAGLLHDLGVVLLDQYVHNPFCRVLDALDAQTPSWQTERRILGFDHAGLGCYVAKRWNLPAALADAIGYHHVPDRYVGPELLTVCVVSLADCLCHNRGITSLGIPQNFTPPMMVFHELGLDRVWLKAIVDDLDHTLESAQQLAAAQLR
jgi:HD-like signal output (HDOD) protein